MDYKEVTVQHFVAQPPEDRQREGHPKDWDSYPLPQLDIQLKESPSRGYGVFATRDFKKDEVIEFCRVLVLDQVDIGPGAKLWDYCHGDSQGRSCYYLMLGYGDIYNHHNRPNIRYQYADENQELLAVIAISPIKAGEEIFASYGKDWFKARGEAHKYIG